MPYFIGPLKKKPDQSEYDNLISFLMAEIELAKRRIDALKRTKERDPEWKYLDRFADDFKTIDILIEEWEAILWALNEDQNKLNAKMLAPVQGVLV